MPHFFLLLFKINVVLLLFAAAYYLILRKLTFYTLNRVFLLFGILFSTAYPFIDLSDFFSNEDAIPALVPVIKENVQRLMAEDTTAIYWQALLMLFYAGALFMAIRLMFQFISLRRMHNQSAIGFVNNLKVRILKEKVTPFSFWQTIYINPQVHKQEDLDTILEHEKIHVEEWHTIDILLAEVSLIFYWFNPGIWMMKKAVKENIEFITDARVLSKGIDRKAYQYSLLDVGTLQPSVAVVNNFNLSDLKKRIQMMNVKRSSKVNLGRYVFVLPVLLVVTLAFTVNHKQIVLELEPFKKALQKVPFMDRPVAEVVAEPRKSRSIAKIKKQIYLIDTIKKTPVEVIVSKSDSLETKPAAQLFLRIQTSDNKTVGIGASEAQPLKVINAPIALHGTIKDIKISASADQEGGDAKVITVIGYAAPGRITDTRTQYRTRGGDYQVADSLKAKMSIRYVVNGKKIGVDELNKMEVGDIKSVVVEKGNKDLNEVVVTARGIKK